MENKHNIKIEVNAVPCPKCEEGHLLPFLRAIGKGRGMYSTEFDHYEIYYKCSNPDCLYQCDDC